MKRAPTIVDVAEKAGVSKSTVSRVIGGDGVLVHPVTRRRVMAAAAKMGYEPNAVASSLRTTRTKMVMLAIPDIANPFWPDVARGVQDTLDREGYAVVFANSDWNGEQEHTFLQMARRNRFAGIIINPIQVTPRELHATRVPIVLIGWRDHLAKFDTVGTDSAAATRMALDYLFGLGHRRIALILGERANRPEHSRLSGFLEFQRAHKIRPDEGLVVHVPFNLQGGYQGLQQLLELRRPPTAVLAANDILAMGALQAARGAGLDVPNVLSIVGQDDIFAAGTTSPALTTVAKPKYEMGQKAATFLLDRIRGAEFSGVRRFIFPCTLQVRGSTAPAPS